jgi:hypothetical protein
MDSIPARLEELRPGVASADCPAEAVRDAPCGSLAVGSRTQALAKVREEVRQFIPLGCDLVAELIGERRREVEDDVLLGGDCRKRQESRWPQINADERR